MLDFAVDLSKRAGALLMDRYRAVGRTDIVDRKGQIRNLVTEADRASERLILDEIAAAYPDHSVAAEETGAREGDPDFVWHVDPLDGTVNFTHGHPFFAVSLGLVMKGKPHLGAIHAPRLGETFSGEVGKGAWLDGTPIEVSKSAELIESLLATGFAYVRNEHPDHNVDNFSTLIMQARGIRRAGAASLDLAYVAAGRLDGFWELHLSSWDVAAGVALVRAAGGTVTDFRGGDDFLEGGHILATNGLIHESVRDRLAPLRDL
jgi:myo-inositol-1(or 4)-monophosphatase